MKRGAIKITTIAAALVFSCAAIVARSQSTTSSIDLARETATRGEQFRRKWDLAKAEVSFREALALDPANLNAVLGLARLARTTFRYAEALRLLNEASRYHRNAPELLSEYGFVYLAAEEPGRARRYFEEALRFDPSSLASSVGRAGVDLLERDYAAAESRLNAGLARDAKNSRVLLMLARVLVEKNQNVEAGARADEALQLDPYDTEAIYLSAFIKAAARKPEEVRALAVRGLALDPCNPGLRRMLSSYLDGQAGYNEKVSEAARQHYARAFDLKREGKLAESAVELEAALRIEPRYYRALISLGDVRLREGDHQKAATVARLAIQADPEGAAGHLELSYANLGIQEEARMEIGATDFAATFYREAAAPVFDLTVQLFPDYRSLTGRQQIVIDRVVAPMGQFLPRLVAGNARHYLLPFDRRLSDIPEADHAGAKKTFDGRFYSSVRGVGGRITVSGIEYVEMAARRGANIIAHEFAHQVHIAALGADDVRLVRRLYERALHEGRTLDFYAAADEYEYFAQGYEAFVSTIKRPAASVTARHTNRELSGRDPQLYQLFVRLAEGSRLYANKQSVSGSRGFGRSGSAAAVTPRNRANLF
jgi:tetratricopeptide (TPR) repeat protein